MATDDAFTVEGLDENDLSDKERANLKRMRDAYLKKTTALAEQRRKSESDMSELQAQYTEAQQQLHSVQQWWTALTPEQQNYYNTLTPGQQTQVLERQGLEDPNTLNSELSQLRQQFQGGLQQLNAMRGELGQLAQRNQTLENALRLQHSLFDLRLKHPDMDPQRVLETAKERGLTDMELSYRLAYDDELRAKAVDSEVTKRMDEERGKMQAERDLVDTKPSTTRYAPPGEAKTYAEASGNLLSAVRKSGSGPLID